MVLRTTSGESRQDILGDNVLLSLLSSALNNEQVHLSFRVLLGRSWQAPSGPAGASLTLAFLYMDSSFSPTSQSNGLPWWLRWYRACNAEDLGSIPGSGRSPGEGNGNPLQYPCLENPMDGGAWWATVRGVAQSWTRLSDFTLSFSPTSLPFSLRSFFQRFFQGGSAVGKFAAFSRLSLRFCFTSEGRRAARMVRVPSLRLTKCLAPSSACSRGAGLSLCPGSCSFLSWMLCSLRCRVTLRARALLGAP